MSSRITGPEIKSPDLKAINLRLSGNLDIRGKVNYSEGPRRGRLLAALQDGGRAEFANVLDRILREAISAEVWALRNGRGDIIDSGELLRSGDVSVNGSSSLVINYDVPYAALVHYGGYIRPYGSPDADLVYLPPRPWVTSVLQSEFGGYSMVQVYSNILRKIFASI